MVVNVDEHDEARGQYGALILNESCFLLKIDMKILITHDTSCSNDIILMYRGIGFSRKMPLCKSTY